MTRAIEGLNVNVEQMKRNVDDAGEVLYSQRVLLLLARLGLPRQVAYEHVRGPVGVGRHQVARIAHEPYKTAVGAQVIAFDGDSIAAVGPRLGQIICLPSLVGRADVIIELILNWDAQDNFSTTVPRE